MANKIPNKTYIWNYQGALGGELNDHTAAQGLQEYIECMNNDMEKIVSIIPLETVQMTSCGSIFNVTVKALIVYEDIVKGG